MDLIIECSICEETGEYHLSEEDIKEAKGSSIYELKLIFFTCKHCGFGLDYWLTLTDLFGSLPWETSTTHKIYRYFRAGESVNFG